MHIFRCAITLHESLFFATRELGRLYETGRYLHNYALSYALGLARATWHQAEHIPHYAEDLSALNGQTYVTPAEPDKIHFQLATFKYGEEELHVEMLQATRNTPSFGRAKEIAPESSFHFYVLSAEPISLPRWIRLGKWHSKALLECEEVAWERKTGPYRAAAPLNPLDLSGDILRAFDIISMPPSSLVANAQCYGEYYAFKENPAVGLPVGLHYNFKA